MAKFLQIVTACLFILTAVAPIDTWGAPRINSGEEFEHNHLLYTYYEYGYYGWDDEIPSYLIPIYDSPCVVLIDCADEFYLSSNLVVPDEIPVNGEKVPVIAFGKRYKGFKGAEKIQSISLGKNVRCVSGGGGYPNLKTLKLNDGLVMINQGAFSSSSLTEVTIPASVRYLGDECFQNNPISSIQFIDDPNFSGERGLIIKSRAFYYRANDGEISPISIKLPTQIENVDPFSFSIPGVYEFEVAAGCEIFKTHEGVLYKKFNDNWNAWIYPRAKESDNFVFPEFLSGGRICGYFMYDLDKGNKINSLDFSHLTKPIVIEGHGIEPENHLASSRLNIQNVDSIYPEGIRVACSQIDVDEKTRYLNNGDMGSIYVKYSVSEKNPWYKSTEKGDLLKIYEDGYELVKPAVTKNDKKYSFPSGVTALGDKAFYFFTELEEVTFSRELNRIGKDVFFGCNKLLKLNINNAPVEYMSPLSLISQGVNGSVWYNTQPAGAVYVGKTLYRWKPDANGEVNGNLLNVNYGITTLTPYCFSNYISPNRYFRDFKYQMKSVSLPGTLTYIGEGAFYQSKQLQSIAIPASVDSIGTLAFNGTALSKINIPVNVKYVGRGAFGVIKNLEEIIIGEYYAEPNTILGPAAFSSARNVQKLLIGGNVTEIGESCFIYLAEEAEPIDIEIPSSVYTIGKSAFSSARIKRLKIGEGVASIGAHAFHAENYNHETQAYYTDLEEVHILASEPPIAIPSEDEETIPLFSDLIYMHVPLFVPSGSVEKYKNSVGWSQFSRIVAEGEDPGEDPNSVLGINEEPTLSINGRSLTICAGDDVPVSVLGLDGMLIYSGKGDSEITLSSPGTVIVKIGKRVEKLLIK